MYISNAEWVIDEHGSFKSTDKHNTLDEANSVCKALEKDGLGGEGKIFPIKTYVTKVD